MANVFLTGEKAVGKSRAVRAAAERINLEKKGFLTRFLTRERGGSSLYMVPADNPAQLDGDHIVAKLENGKMRAVPDRFDTLGVRLLREALECPGALILMDECGHLEKNALLFQQAILECLNAANPVLGVLRKDQDWHDFIRAHPDTYVITVTENNRADMADTIVKLLGGNRIPSPNQDKGETAE